MWKIIVIIVAIIPLMAVAIKGFRLGMLKVNMSMVERAMGIRGVNMMSPMMAHIAMQISSHD